MDNYINTSAWVFCVARSTRLGNARASNRGTSDRVKLSRFFYICDNTKIIFLQESARAFRVEAMARICLNTRDELIIIDLNKVAFMRANGNYTNIMYIDGVALILSLGISKVEDLVKQAYPLGTKSPFVRLGRSIIINQSYLSRINIQKQKLYLYDYKNHIHNITIPKYLLRDYKEFIKKQYTKKNE